MTESLSSFDDEQAANEYAMLWLDVKEMITRNVGNLGIREAISDYTNAYERTKVVLQSEPIDKQIVQLWGLPTQDELIGQVTVSFQNPDTQVESHCYEFLPRKLTYYGRGIKKARFTREELEDLRADLQEITWDPSASEAAAKHAVFWDV